VREKMSRRDIQNGADAIYLGTPVYNAPEPSTAARFAMYAALLTLGVLGAAACFYSVFPVAVNAGALTVLVCCSSVLTTALFLSSLYRRILLAALGAAAALTLIFREELLPLIADGAVRAANVVIGMYGSEANVDFAAIPVEYADPAAVRFSTTIFAALLLVCVTLAVGWLIIRRRSALFPFLITALFPGAALAYTIIPHFAAMAALGLFWLFLLMFVAPSGGRDRLFEKRSSRGRRAVFRGGGKSAVRPSALVALPLIALCMIVVFTAFPEEGYKRPQAVIELRDGIVSGRIGLALFHSGGVAGSVNRVDLRHAGNLRHKGETAIRVRTTKPAPDYLKGFVGSVYTGSGWGQLTDADALGELSEIISDVRPQNYVASLYRYIDETREPDESSGSYGSYERNESITERFSYELSVENVNVNPRCVYSPYGLMATPGGLADMEFVSDGFLRSSNGMFGIGGYTLGGIAIPVSMAYIDTLSYGDMPDEFFESMAPEQEALFRSWSRYGEFANEHYTDLPADIEGMLGEYLAERGLDRAGFNTTADFILAVVRAVQEENTYTLSPGPLPDDRDFVEYFLSENHRGYCVHFATSVALLLRSAGIPARYAEGFVVSPDEPATENGWINIKDSRAHAWVEVYVNAVGWVPVEATPSRRSGVSDPSQAGALGDMIPETQPEPDTEDDADTVSGAAAEEGADNPEEEDSDPDAAETDPAVDDEMNDMGLGGAGASGGGAGGLFGSGGGSGGVPGAVRVAVPAAAIVLALIVVARKRRRVCIEKRAKLFGDADRSKAAIAAYAYAGRLLAFAGRGAADPADGNESGEGIPAGGGDPRAAEDAIYNALPEHLKSVVLKARFSLSDPSEEELAELAAYAKDLSARTSNSASPLRRFVGAYLLGLF
jgi:hypothetical protein